MRGHSRARFACWSAFHRTNSTPGNALAPPPEPTARLRSAAWSARPIPRWTADAADARRRRAADYPSADVALPAAAACGGALLILLRCLNARLWRASVVPRKVRRQFFRLKSSPAPLHGLDWARPAGLVDRHCERSEANPFFL